MPSTNITTLMVRGSTVRVHSVECPTGDAREFAVVSAEGRATLRGIQDVTADGYQSLVTSVLNGNIDAACSKRHAGLSHEQAADAFMEWWATAMEDGFQYIAEP